jgi:peroxiredoxin
MGVHRKPQLLNLAEDKLKDQKSTFRLRREQSAQAKNSQALLNSKLLAYRRESAIRRPAFAKAYDDLIERLNVIDRGQVGPQLGDLMPGFDLPDETGRFVSLSSLLQSGPVVISINRGHWCPYCKLELQSLAAIHNEIEHLGARVISIMPDSARFTVNYIAQNNLPFPVLSDIDLGYSLSLGLIFWVGAEIQKLYEQAGVELEKYQGNRSYFLPMAAKFIVGHDGLVAARQVNIEFRERMEPETIIATLRELQTTMSV